MAITAYAFRNFSLHRIREQLLEVLCWWMLVRPSRSSTLSTVPSSPNFSSIGARLGGGGPCKRDGAPASNAFLKLRSVCSRRISWRALYSAIDNFSTSGILSAATLHSKSSHCRPASHETLNEKKNHNYSQIRVRN